MGTISLVAGQPKEGISVEARSDSKGLYEETTTDSLGNYRLRGLLPDTSYVIKVKEDLGSIKIERASPEFVAVEVRVLPVFATHFMRGVCSMYWDCKPPT